eukprot:16450301-Heterocapsa_arctica.AAC.1
MEVDYVKGRGKGGPQPSQPWRRADRSRQQAAPARAPPPTVWKDGMKPCRFCGGRHLHSDCRSNAAKQQQPPRAPAA